jgi:hypothetical protein
MKRRDALQMAAAAALADARSRFAGVWRLRSCVRTFRDGRREIPFGEKPVGRLQYDLEGRMSALAMRPGRRSTLGAGVEIVKAGEAELREAVAGFVGYFGTFEVDEPAQTVNHHVEASLAPNAVGTVLVRRFRFEGNRLILTRTGAESSDVLVWEK